VFLWAKDALAEQAVFFRPVRAVVDRLGLFHLAKRPRANVVGPSQADFHRGVIVNAVVGGFADGHVLSPSGVGGAGRVFGMSNVENQMSNEVRKSNDE